MSVSCSIYQEVLQNRKFFCGFIIIKVPRFLYQLIKIGKKLRSIQESNLLGIIIL